LQTARDLPAPFLLFGVTREQRVGRAKYALLSGKIAPIGASRQRLVKVNRR
jgi:hypothetical protein